MEITWLGHSSFRIKGKTSTVVTDPYDSSVGFKFPKVEANIVTISHGHADHSNRGGVGGAPRVIDGPGEYEIGGVSIFGIATYHDDKQGSERGPNTVYVITIESVNVCHLGDLGHKLSEEQVGEIGSVDVLLTPVGGVYSLTPALAAEVVSELEPKIVIPMHYQVPGLNSATFGALERVDEFIKEVGVEPIKDSKFVITKDKIPEEMQVVVLERRG